MHFDRDDPTEFANLIIGNTKQRPVDNLRGPSPSESRWVGLAVNTAENWQYGGRQAQLKSHKKIYTKSHKNHLEQKVNIWSD